jgi:aconitate hydratase
VISSYNRNFVGRHDGNPGTHSFVTSPELVAAFAFAGSLQFNPSTETIATPDGKAFAFSSPHAEELPSHFEDGTALYQAPPENGEDIDVHVAPDSQNLQLLTPFEPWHEGKARDLSILITVKGKKYYLLIHSPTQSLSSQITLTPHPQANAQQTTSPPPAPGTNTAAT